MNSLVNSLGIVDAERFISGIMRDRGDYTTLRRQLFDDLSLEDVFKNAEGYMAEHPFDPETESRLRRTESE